MKLLKGLLVLALQAVLSLALFWAATMLLWVGGPWYSIAAWGAMPLLGMALAFFAVKLGVNNYLAWIAPPVCAFVAHYIATGYTPGGAGPTLLTAFLSVVGAAAGLVSNERGGRAHER